MTTSALAIMLHEASQTPRFAPIAYPRQHCPECMIEFAPAHARPIFCSGAHQANFQNRMTVRGRVLAPLAIAAHITRGGTRDDKTTGREARRDAEHLMRRWASEDKAAGRMSATAYMALRYRKGFTIA